VVNVARVDIRLTVYAGPRDQIGVAGGIDNDFSQNRVTAFFAFKDRAADDAIINDRRRAPGVKQETHLGLLYHPHRQRFKCLGIDRGRSSDDAVVSGGAISPVSAGRALDSILW
jgi:hypothetical protein